MEFELIPSYTVKRSKRMGWSNTLPATGEKNTVVSIKTINSLNLFISQPINFVVAINFFGLQFNLFLGYHVIDHAFIEDTQRLNFL